MPSATISSDTGGVATRVTSTRFVGRTPRARRAGGRSGDAAAGRPSLAFVAGESGVGKTRLLAELERRAREARRTRPQRRLRRARRGRAALRAARRALRPLARERRPRARRARPAPARAELASAAPRARRRARRRCAAADASAAPPSGALFEALLALLDRLGARRPGPAGRSRTSTGPTARRAPSSPSWPAACAPSGCWSSLTYRSDELHRRHPLRPLLAELERAPRARRDRARPPRRATSSPSSSADILGAPPTPDLVERLCGAARATRSSPRSSWPPGSTGAAACPRRCATR